MSAPGTLRFLIPGDLDTPTGGYRYDRRMLDGLRGLGWRVTLHPLDATFPDPSPAALAQAGSLLASIPEGSPVVVDGLAYGAMPELAEVHGRRLSLIALVHHPLAEETGLAPERAAALRRAESRALAQARLVLVTSRTTARLLARYGVPASRIRAVEPGTDPAPAARGAPDGEPRLLCVASLVPRKGHDLLLGALARLQDRPWRLDCVGSADRDPDWTRRLVALREKLGLAGRVAFSGVLTDLDLAHRYAAADLFVLPTRFEGYGMALTEAMAWGLPILAARGGAVPETVPPEAGVLVAPNDAQALSEALRRLLDDPRLRRRLAAGSRAAGLALPTWEQAAAAFAEACASARRPIGDSKDG